MSGDKTIFNQFVKANGRYNIKRSWGFAYQFRDLWVRDGFHFLLSVRLGILLPAMFAAHLLWAAFLAFLLALATNFDVERCLGGAVSDPKNFYFFTVETMFAIGFGTPRYPSCDEANWMVSIIVVATVLFNGIVLGVIFAKFSSATRRRWAIFFSSTLVGCRSDSVFTTSGGAVSSGSATDLSYFGQRLTSRGPAIEKSSGGMRIRGGFDVGLDVAGVGALGESDVDQHNTTPKRRHTMQQIQQQARLQENSPPRMFQNVVDLASVSGGGVPNSAAAAAAARSTLHAYGGNSRLPIKQEGFFNSAGGSRNGFAFQPSLPSLTTVNPRAAAAAAAAFCSPQQQHTVAVPPLASLNDEDDGDNCCSVQNTPDRANSVASLRGGYRGGSCSGRDGGEFTLSFRVMNLTSQSFFNTQISLFLLTHAEDQIEISRVNTFYTDVPLELMELPTTISICSRDLLWLENVSVSDLQRSKFRYELLALLTFTDNRTSRTIEIRKSWLLGEARWNVWFSDVLRRSSDGTYSVNVDALDEVEPLTSAAAATAASWQPET